MRFSGGLVLHAWLLGVTQRLLLPEPCPAEMEGADRHNGITIINGIDYGDADLIMR